MAKLFNIAVLLMANLLLIRAEDDCKCSETINSEEVKEVWEFLSKNSPDQAVYFGELTELVPCRNCIEQKRRKRRIEEEENERQREERSVFPTHRIWRHINNERNKCASGYRRFLGRCIRLE